MVGPGSKMHQATELRLAEWTDGEKAGIEDRHWESTGVGRLSAAARSLGPSKQPGHKSATRAQHQVSLSQASSRAQPNPCTTTGCDSGQEQAGQLLTAVGQGSQDAAFHPPPTPAQHGGNTHTYRHTALHWMPSSQNPALTQSGEAQFSLDKAPCSAPPQGQHTLHRKVRGSAHMLCQLQQWLLYTLEGRSRQGGCLALQGCLSDH